MPVTVKVAPAAPAVAAVGKIVPIAGAGSDAVETVKGN